jgi:hypothetical protein
VGFELLHEWCEVSVVDERLVPGVVYNVGYVFRGQHHVEGVEDGAHAGDGPVQIEVPDGIPVERGHLIARPHAHLP